MDLPCLDTLIAFSMMPIIFHSVPLIPLNATFFPFRCVSASLVSSCQLKIKWKLTKFWLFAITSFCPKRIHCTPMLQALIPKAPHHSLSLVPHPKNICYTLAPRPLLWASPITHPLPRKILSHTIIRRIHVLCNHFSNN